MPCIRGADCGRGTRHHAHDGKHDGLLFHRLQHEQFRAGEGLYSQSGSERELPLHLPHVLGNGRPQGIIRSPSENEPRKDACGRFGRLAQGKNLFKNGPFSGEWKSFEKLIINLLTS